MLQTQYSVQANDFAESYRGTMGRLRVGPWGYVPDVTAPEGPSTGGGVQALQHLRLVPSQPNLPTLVVGSVNGRDRTAELRTLEHVEAIYRDRFKQGAPVDPGHYGAFLQSAHGFLSACGLRVAYSGPPAELLARLAAPTPSMVPQTGSARILIGVVGTLVLVGVLAAAFVWFFVIAR
jgi:hypothetical protein